MEALDRTLDILEVFLKRPDEVGIAELADTCGMNISTAYRIASGLVKRGYLKQAEKRGKYSLGIKILEFNMIIQNTLKIGHVALPYLQKLSKLSGEYSEVAVRDSQAAVTVAQVEVDNNLKISNVVGERLPLHATSIGRVLLAYLSPAERKVFYSQNKLEKYTENTLTDPYQLEHNLETIREKGFGIDSEEYALGVWAVAAPVFNFSNSVIAVLSIAAPIARVYDAKALQLTNLVQRVSLDLSKDMGYKS